MRRFPILCSVAGLCLTALPALGETLNCRVQVYFTCDPACEESTGPADLSLDLTAMTGDFCRGETCDTGALSVLRAKGQWDDGDYLLFRLSGDKGAFQVSGAVQPGAKAFAGVSDELGQITGTCEAGGS